jgi:hypothetical protein
MAGLWAASISVGKLFSDQIASSGQLTVDVAASSH